MNDAQIKYMVDRFLGWHLPKDFYPDAGISYKPTQFAASHPDCTPTGTNLFDADQARAMVGYMIEGLPDNLQDDEPRIIKTQLPCGENGNPIDYVLGRNCTLIEQTSQNGEYCMIPYIRVWDGDRCLAEFCQHKASYVMFGPTPPLRAAQTQRKGNANEPG